MKNALLVALITLFVGHAAHAAAEILAKDGDSNTVQIALDAKGTPRINGKAKTYPTIKDFRRDADYAWFCYKGSVSETRKLLKALVSAADGDGDSYASLVSISNTTPAGTLKVVATITDESGEKNESYYFRVCKF